MNDVGLMAQRALRRATAPLRPLPELLVIGAIRGGTTAMAEWLTLHPEVKPPWRKEVKFFDMYYDRGENWYCAFFPLGSGHLTFDATPSYMTHPDAAERAAELLPGAKVLALLRDPVERAWSNYRLRKSSGREVRAFDQAIDEELEDLSPLGRYAEGVEIPFLRPGLYAPQLRPWLKLYPPQQVKILASEDLYSGDQDVRGSLLSWLGVEDRNIPFPRANSAPPAPLEPETRQRLEALYAGPNSELEDLLEAPLSWM